MSLNYSQNVEILGKPGLARQLAAGATSANTVISGHVYRISMRAVGADIRFELGMGWTRYSNSKRHYFSLHC